MDQAILLADGKYVFEGNSDGTGLRCLRHGHPWREFVGDNAVRSLFDYALELEQKWHTERSAHLHYKELAELYGAMRDKLVKEQ